MKNKIDMKKLNQIKGFSIVELMIAIFIGSIILTGLITIFETTSNMNRTQNGLARLQESGRFATLHMKTALDQAGYQYCLSSGVATAGGDFNGDDYSFSASVIKPWLVLDGAEVFPGVPSGPLLDAQYFIHGHECTGSACIPSLTSPGSDLSTTIPNIGTGDGQRIAGTDVLTVRYLHGNGFDVASIGPNLAGAQIITYEPHELARTDFPEAGSKVLIASCSIDRNHVVANTITGSSAQVSVSTNGANINEAVTLTKVFDINRHVRSITYYVANQVVDGRDIPTLYSVINGVVNALVEGVDRFDVLYTVQTNEPGQFQVLDASGVDAMPAASCVKAADDTVNGPGCGWRSVASIEFHLLLNTVADSSAIDDEPFFYSIDGNNAQTAADLPSTINHYRMHRREFYSVVATKNWN